MTTRTSWLVAVLLAGLATPALAQIPVGTRVGLPLSSGYDDGARRDPFVSLIQPKKTSTPQPLRGTRPRTGLAAMSLSDVVVTGLVKTGKAMMAVLQGPDRQSFVAHEKDHLMDAVIKRIDEQGVVFAKQDATGALTANEIRKSLRPAAEVIR
jgi:hypothetical protein